MEVLSVEATAVEAVMEQRVMHLKGNGETTLVAQADGPNLLATLARTYTEALMELKTSVKERG